jgi:hypothetical protein
MTLAKQSSALDRIAQNSHRFIGRSCPLNRDPKISVRRGCEAIRVHDSLHLPIRRFERSSIKRVLDGEPQ